MDAILFAKMLSDKHITDLKRLKYKYPDADIKEFVNLLKVGMYKELPIKDIVYAHSCLPITDNTAVSVGTRSIPPYFSVDKLVCHTAACGFSTAGFSNNPQRFSCVDFKTNVIYSL